MDIPYSRRVEPSVSCYDSAFVHTPWAKTDVTMTWRRFGWEPVRHAEKQKPQEVVPA